MAGSTVPRPGRQTGRPGQASAAAGDPACGAPLASCPLDRVTVGTHELAGDVLVIAHGSRLHALSARCPHGAASLAAGTVSRGVITCPLHGARFRLRDGRALAGPVRTPLRLFSAEVRDADLVVLDRPPVPRGLLDRLRSAVKGVCGGRVQPRH